MPAGPEERKERRERQAKRGGVPIDRVRNAHVPDDAPPFCCHAECNKDAEFQIRGETAAIDDMTHACEDHVGALLGTPIVASRDNKAWIVTQL